MIPRNTARWRRQKNPFIGSNHTRDAEESEVLEVEKAAESVAESNKRPSIERREGRGSTSDEMRVELCRICIQEVEQNIQHDRPRDEPDRMEQERSMPIP